MSLTDEETLELHELLDGLVENNLSPANKAKLEKWIAQSDEARRRYVYFMDMSSSLAHFAEEILSDETEEDIGIATGEKILRFVRPALLIAALLVAGFYFPRFMVDDNEDRTDIASEKKSLVTGEEKDEVIVDTVAVLTKTVGVVWSDDSPAKPESGNTIEPCRLKLESGLAQIEFLQGSTVVLEGPVEFEVINPNGGALSLGKLRASVPQVASGFTIELPKGKVIDLGTEFGLHVHEGGSTELFVYQGKVLYEGQAGQEEDVFREVSRLESIFIDPYGFPRSVEMPTEPFISKADLAYKSMEESQRRHSAWADMSKQIAQDPKTRLYFSFDNHSPWSRILRDDSISKDSSTNGAVIGCKWEEGRWSGKGALAFKRPNDRVRLNLPQQLSSATLAAWIKIDALPSSLAPIIHAEPFTLGAACWSINKQGQLAFRVKSTNGFDLYESAVAFGMERLGSWTHVATALDSKSKMISHYVNGRSFSHEKMNEMVPLTFEKSLLGHSFDMPGHDGVALRGSIDEFVIFETAYEEDAIRHIFEGGGPYVPASHLGTALP